MNKEEFESKFIKSKQNWIEVYENIRIYGNDYEIFDDVVMIFKENLLIADLKLSKVQSILNREVWL
ncbi:MAG: hypothetical protein ACP5MU_06235 [Thermoplasmata archaeon]